MQLEIVTPEANIYSGEVSYVQLPGSAGQFGVLNNHAPLITTLQKGQVKIKDDKEADQFFEIGGGVVEVLNNKVIILAESAHAD